MKRLLAGLLIGLAIGGGSAYAATSNYWLHDGVTYHCDGGQLYARCFDDVWQQGYNFLIAPSFVGLYEGKRPVFSCPRKYHSLRCTDLR
jgi:hypothetical protein